MSLADEFAAQVRIAPVAPVAAPRVERPISATKHRQYRPRYSPNTRDHHTVSLILSDIEDGALDVLARRRDQARGVVTKEILVAFLRNEGLLT